MLNKKSLWTVAKLLEGIGLIIVLVGLTQSISLGMNDDGLGSMTSEFRGLGVGGGIFIIGVLLERATGTE